MGERSARALLPKADTQRRSPATLDAMVLELLAHGDRPLTIGELERRSEKMGWRLRRMQLHRVLARLIRREAAKRVELLGAYIPGGADADCLLVCSSCGAVQKLPLPSLRMSTSALCQREGFAPSRLICEVPGRCAPCIGGMAD
ncbi:hypothetical protein ACMGDH_12040 [Sphingomonas sp. DT-207]|uniref:hypothetical protein n=1 Tax=Sphingomonas sp. DT-207 TaxID=3396167 RepID=UPI003F1C67D4